MKPISLVMLVHNEEDVIENTVREYYREVIQKIPGSEFILAEDGSTDGTKEILLRLEKELPLRVVSGNDRKGYTKAMLDGLQLVQNNIIFFSDSDGQHDPEDFWLLYNHIDDYDIVSGYKSHRKDGQLRVLVSWGMNLLLSVFFGVKLKDANCGFKLIKKHVVEKLSNEKFLMRLASAELMIRAINHKFKIKEIPVKHFERKFGNSRGIPTKKIPGFIIETISTFVKLKKDV
jgi:glycosyltransferase involved in cell wall biosynthesis